MRIHNHKNVELRELDPEMSGDVYAVMRSRCPDMHNARRKNMFPRAVVVDHYYFNRAGSVIKNALNSVFAVFFVAAWNYD